MKRQIQLLLLTVLMIAFSACESKQYSLNDFKIPQLPSFDERKLDQNIKTVSRLKIKTSMSQVALEWEPRTDQNIAGYRIFRKDPKGNYQLIATLADRYRSHYIDRNSNNNVNYAVSIYTKDGRESKARSINSKKPRMRLNQPRLVEVISNLPSRVKLILKPEDNNIIKSYIVERKEKNNTKWVKVANLQSRLSAEYIDKDVIPGQIYYYRIKSKSFDGVISAPSQALSGYSKRVPFPVTRVKATDNVARVINIIWTDRKNNKNVLHYNIYSSTLKNTLFSLLASTKKTNYTDEFDTDGVTRYYKITTVDIDGLESPQEELSTIGKTIGASRGPVIHSATVQQNAIVLKWNDPDSRARKYTIVKKFWNGWRPVKESITDYKKRTYIDKNVKEDTKYTYYIFSIDRHGIESMPSKEVILSIQPR